MNILKISLSFLILSLSLPIFANEAKSSDDYKMLLTTGTDNERMQALDYFAKEKDKSQIPVIIEILRDGDSPKLAQKAAITLGLIGEKGESTQALKEKIESNQSPEITYACILAIFNIHRKDDERDPVAVEALRYADQNQRQDPFVADLLDRLKAKFLSDTPAES